MSEPREPDAATLARLWQSVRPHPFPAEQLGEYAAIRQRQGEDAARAAFPALADHLTTDCQICAADLSEIDDLLAAEQVRAFAIRAGRVLERLGGEWLTTFARGLRFASQPIGHGPGSPVEEAPGEVEPPPPWAPRDEPAVLTLELDVEGEQSLIVEASPYGDGTAIVLRRSDRNSVRAQELVNWDVRFEAGDRPESATARTNRSGAAVLADVAFDDLLRGSLTLRPPERSP